MTRTHRLPWLSLATVMTALLASSLPTVTAAAGDCAVPSRADIVIDGDFRDWREVLTNPANATLDADGTTVPCPLSTDRDCGDIGGDGSEYDLMQLGWTWNEDSLFLYVERLEWRPNTVRFFWHLDTSRDGLMQTGEPVVIVHTDGSGGMYWCAVDSYQASAPGGDPLADASGFADGHELAGAASDPSLAPRVGTVADDFNRLRYEASVPWSEVSLSAGEPFRWHAATSGGGSLPNNFMDSAGRADGQPGDTGFRQIQLDAPIVAGAPAPSIVAWTHAVSNLGNLPARPHVRVSSSSGRTLGIRADPDDDGNFDLLLATDTDGDGLFLTPGDSLESAGDTDGDGRLDLGLLAPGETRLYEISLLVPVGSDGLIERVTSSVETIANSGCATQLEDRVHVGDVTLLPDVQTTIVAGGEAWVVHRLVNNTPLAKIVDLDVLSGRAWPWAWYADLVGAGDPADAVLLIDSDATGVPDVPLPAGATVDLLAQVQAPGGDVLGTVESAVLRASSGGLPVSFVNDTVTVREPLSLAPNYLLADGDARYGGRDSWVYFPHRVTNNLGRDATVLLFASSDLGWPAEVMLDPNGDGRPGDAVALPGSSVRLERGGGSATILVRVAFPAAVAEDTRAQATLIAENDEALPDQVQVIDDAIVSIVRTYADAALTVQSNSFLHCTTVHAVATGLTPSDPEHRFLWRDPSGVLLAAADVSTDLTGAASAEHVLQPTDAGDGYTVAIERFDGLSWQEIDRFDFRVEGAAALRVAGLTSPPPGLDPVVVSAQAIVENESWNLPLEALAYRWVLLGPSDLTYWDTLLGAFSPFDGTQATQAGSVDLAPRDDVLLELDLLAVQHEVDAMHRVALFLANGCNGSDIEEASLEYEVLDDDDADGLTRSDEIAAGTDPTDGDSDDDGLLDGEDGTGDSDGDGLIDALDCDSDDDGLPDGLEAGIWIASSWTDLGAGCFRADDWPATTTDPDDADTDDGGVPDGAEDRDGNGRLDPGETDPLDGADDLPCDPTPPAEVTGLRVTRASGGMLSFSWDSLVLDPCSHYDLLSGPAPQALDELGMRATDSTVQQTGLPGTRFYLVRAESDVSGVGPTGH